MQMFGHQDLVTQARSHGNADFGKVQLLIAGCLGDHLLVAFQTGAVLGLTGLRGTADPFQLTFHALGQFSLSLALAGDTRRLGFQIGGVVAFVGEQLATVDFADPFGNVIQEIAVMGYRKHSTLVGLQELLQPQHGFDVQMVGGLV